MTYDQRHIPVYDPATGYNKLRKRYKDFHDHLDSFEKGQFLRYLPRDTKGLAAIDLGAGDGRLYKQLHNYTFARYVACDIAKDLLAEHPGKGVEKIVCDLESALPFDDNTFDIAFTFFVLEHIADLPAFASEVYRIMKSQSRRIVGYFLQKRPFVHKQGKDEFRIQQYHYSLKELEDIFSRVGFTIHVQEIFEKNVLLGYILVCEK